MGWAEDIKVFHTSDVHGFYFPRTVQGKKIGGYPALAGYLETQKRPFLLLDSGDFTSGTYEAKKSKGGYSVDFLNELSYNAVTIGNHENDFKDAAMLENLKNLKADILSVNLEDVQTGTYPTKVLPYKIYDIEGYKIAVIGVSKSFSTKSKMIKVRGARGLLKKALFRVKELKPDAIILLAHESAQDDKHEDFSSMSKLTKDIDGIDLVLGGHAHKVIQNKKIGNTVFVESGTALEGVSEVTLTFDDYSRTLKNVSSKYVLLDNAQIDIPKDIEIFTENYRAKEMDKVLTSALEDISNIALKDSNAADSPLGDLFCDIILEETGADIAVQNSGGIRGRGLVKGQITRRIVEEIFPFPNKIMIVKVNGGFIEKLVRKNLRANSSLFQYAGLQVKYKYKNNRAEIKEILINGKPLNRKQIYTLAVPDFIANGNSEGYMFKKIEDKKIFSDEYIGDIFRNYLSKNLQGIKAPQNIQRMIRVN